MVSREPGRIFREAWIALPQWQQETDADIFERVELEYMERYSKPNTHLPL